MPNREPADLLIEPRWLLPMAPASGALAEQAVVIGAGRIIALGPVNELRARFEPRETLRRTQHALLPGFVNASTHASHSLLRGLLGQAPRGLDAALAGLEARSASADFVRDGTRLGMAEMLRAGVTCFADLSPYPEEAARTAAAAQMRAAIGLPVSDGASPWAENATAHFAKAERLWDEYRSDSRISLYFAPLAAHSLSDATLTRIRRVADELDARVALDVCTDAEPAETADQVRDGAAVRRGASAAGLLLRLDTLGLVRPGFTAIGLGAADARDVEILSRHGASAVACPRVQLRRGGVLLIPRLAGSRTGLGTGSPALGGGLEVLAEARLAALAGGLGAGEALRMATLGGATTLGLQAQIGSIEAGKAADLVCMDLGALECRTAPDIETAVLFGTTRSQVSDVWTGGRCAVSAGRLLAFDEEEIAGLPARWLQRLRLEAAA